MNQKKTVSGGDLLKCKLLVTVVDHRKEDFFIDYIQENGANLQLTMRGEGTAKTEMLRMLGLTDSEKTVLLSVIREDLSRALCDGLAEKFKTVKNGQGIAFTIPLSSVVGALVYRFLSDQKTGGTV
ncbi:MAG: hypothetical protein IKV66_02250 [Clostridia bacterium]|jgi:hypothetical protein|nr:hypothetical protein [Clostridia bacterium]